MKGDIKTVNRNDYKVLRKSAILNLFQGVITILAALLIANYTTRIVAYATKANTYKVINTSKIFISIIILNQIIILFFNIMRNREKSKAVQRFKYTLYNSFLRQPLDKIKKLYGGRTGALNENFTNDLDQVTRLYVEVIPNTLISILTVFCYFIYIGFYDKKIAIVILLISFTQIIPPIIVRKFMTVNYENTREVEAKLTDYMIEIYTGMDEIKSSNLSKYCTCNLSKLHEEYFKTGVKSEVTVQCNNAMNEAIIYLLKFGTYAVVGWLTLKGIVTLKGGINSVVLSEKLYSAVSYILSIIPEIGVFKKAEYRLAYLNKSENYKKVLLSNSFINTEEYMKASNLSFCQGKNEIFNNLCFYIKRKDIVVIKGSNGCGKSTLFNIILGIYTNYLGSIQVRRQELRDINKEDFYKGICYLAQDEEGFSLTGYEFFKLLEEAHQLKFEEAIKLSKNFNIDEQILKDVNIRQLSGGEKKKIYLISCLLKTGDYLLLDEPGNSLDAEAKEVVKGYIKNSNKTVLIITHDPFFEEISTGYIEFK